MRALLVASDMGEDGAGGQEIPYYFGHHMESGNLLNLACSTTAVSQEPAGDGGSVLRPEQLRGRGERVGGHGAPRRRREGQAGHTHRTLGPGRDLHR